MYFNKQSGFGAGALLLSLFFSFVFPSRVVLDMSITFDPPNISPLNKRKAQALTRQKEPMATIEFCLPFYYYYSFRRM